MTVAPEWSLIIVYSGWMVTWLVGSKHAITISSARYASRHGSGNLRDENVSSQWDDSPKISEDVISID